MSVSEILMMCMCKLFNDVSVELIGCIIGWLVDDFVMWLCVLSLFG